MLEHFYTARTSQESLHRLKAEMVTTHYDIWLGQYIRHRWLTGDPKFAMALEDERFLLRRCYTADVETAFVEFGRFDEPPAELVETITQIEAITSRAGENPTGRDLNEVVALYSALIGHPRFSGMNARVRTLLPNELGTWLLQRWRTSRQLPDIDASLEAYEKALQSAPDGDWPYTPRFLANGSIALLERFERNRALRDLVLAASSAEKAIFAALPNELNLATYQGAYGSALREVASATNDGWYWRGAADALEQAVALGYPQSEQRLRWQDNLTGMRLMGEGVPIRREAPSWLAGALFAETARLVAMNEELASRVTFVPKSNAVLPAADDPQDLDAAIEQSRRGLQQLPVGSVARAVAAANLAARLLSRLSGSPSGPLVEREEALQLLDEAIPALPRPSDVRVGALFNKALGLSRYGEKPSRGGEQPTKGISRGDSETAISLFRTCCLEAEEIRSQIGLSASATWGQWATERQAWEEAAEAFECGQRIQQKLASGELVRPHAEQRLMQDVTLAPAAAISRIRANQPALASVALERGRAQLMSFALERDRADIEALRASGYGELADRYTAQLAEVAQLDRDQLAADEEVVLTEWGIKYAEHRRQLDATVDEIRAIPGQDDFLGRVHIEQLHEAARSAGCPLVYMLAHKTQGAAVIVNEYGERQLELPILREALVRDHAMALVGAGGDYALLSAAVDRCADWLWDAAMAPLLDAIDSNEIVLIPTGLLGLLPLHAARTADPATATGRRYAMDEVTVRYAPNARALRPTSTRQSPTAPGVVVTAVSAPDEEPLEGVGPEGLVAAAGLGSNTLVLPETRATRGQVLDQVRGAGSFHFACHALADPDDPLHSGLMLKDGLLTVRDLLGTQLVAQLGVLSACETAMVGTTLPDEVISLPSSLIQGGVGGVIGSIWQVPDTPTLLLMQLFYERLHKSKHPAEALHGAQAQLRDSSNESLRLHFQKILDAPPANAALEAVRVMYGQLEEADPDDLLWGDLVAWAGFVYTG